jgi:hypothetical protein
VETGGSLADAADALEADREATSEAVVTAEPGRTDVVRLMNLHKAKGWRPTWSFGDPLGGVKRESMCDRAGGKRRGG